jgi:hypothetical protein
VVPVKSSIRTTPQRTPGIVDRIASGRRRDWKFAMSSRNIAAMARRSPVRRPDIVSSRAGICPRTATVEPFGAAGRFFRSAAMPVYRHLDRGIKVRLNDGHVPQEVELAKLGFHFCEIRVVLIDIYALTSI